MNRNATLSFLLFSLTKSKGLLTPNQNGKPTGMVCPSCGPGAAFRFSPYIVLGNTSKSSCCVLYLTEVRVVIIWVLLALRLSLMIGLPFRPAAFSTPKELTSTKTRQSTTCKSSLGLGLSLKACNIMSLILGGSEVYMYRQLTYAHNDPWSDFCHLKTGFKHNG